MGHTHTHSSLRKLSYGTLCCHRQPVKMLLGDCKSWSQWQTSFWEVTLEPLKLRPACGGGNVGDWLPTLISHPGKKSWATHKKMTIMAGLCCCAEDILSSFSSCLSKFRNVKSLYENGLKVTRFEKTDFIKLDNKTSNIISNFLEILKPSKQDLWSHSRLLNLSNVI